MLLEHIRCLAAPIKLYTNKSIADITFPTLTVIEQLLGLKNFPNFWLGTRKISYNLPHKHSNVDALLIGKLIYKILSCFPSSS